MALDRDGCDGRGRERRGRLVLSLKGAKAADGSKAAAPDTESVSSADQASVVATVRLSPGGITRTCTQIGSVHPYEQADLFAKVSGYLAKLHVNYGDRVKKGQVLAEIDDPEVVADAEKAAADVRQAKAAVSQAEAFIEAAKADRDATASGVEQSVAEVDRYTSMKNYHAKKFARYRDLVQNRAIPQQIADEEEEGYESAQANEAASRKAVLKAKADLIAAGMRVKKAEADLEEATPMSPWPKRSATAPTSWSAIRKSFRRMMALSPSETCFPVPSSARRRKEEPSHC